MSKWDTHLMVCVNPKALDFLLTDDDACCYLMGVWAAKGKPMGVGDALIARDALLDAGFKWGKDFYIRKINID